MYTNAILQKVRQVTDQNGSDRSRIALWGNLPVQPELTSEKVKLLLSKALTNTADMTESEVRELAAAVVYHLVSQAR